MVDQLTVEDNLTLGMEDTTLGFLRKTDKINKIVSVMNSLEPSIHPKQMVSTPERGPEADCGDCQGGRHGVGHHHYGRTDRRALRMRNRAIVQDH